MKAWGALPLVAFLLAGCGEGALISAPVRVDMRGEQTVRQPLISPEWRELKERMADDKHTFYYYGREHIQEELPKVVEYIRAGSTNGAIADVVSNYDNARIHMYIVVDRDRARQNIRDLGGRDDEIDLLYKNLLDDLCSSIFKKIRYDIYGNGSPSQMAAMYAGPISPIIWKEYSMYVHRAFDVTYWARISQDHEIRVYAGSRSAMEKDSFTSSSQGNAFFGEDSGFTEVPDSVKGEYYKW